MQARQGPSGYALNENLNNICSSTSDRTKYPNLKQKPLSLLPKNCALGSHIFCYHYKLQHRSRTTLLKPPMAASGSSAARPSITLPEGTTEQKLSFTNPKGERLVGLFVDTSCSANVVILCHGYMANYNFCQFAALAAGLAEAGISSFRFDHPCAYHGQSELKGNFRMGNHDEEVADMAAAAEYLRKEKGLTVLALLGHSKGGMNVVKYAAEIGDIPNMINLSGRFAVRDGILQRFGENILGQLAAAKNTTPEGGILRTEADGFQWLMTEDDFLERANLPMSEYAKIIRENKNVNMLALHGRQDTTIPWEESQKFAELSGAQLVLVDGDHNYRKPEDARAMIKEVVSFCRRCL
jgi:pimeloyl-ACP methyl ester carboxylesterase